MTPSRRLSRESNSASCGRRGFRGALPGAGKTHSIPALAQFEHGVLLLQRTFLRRQVTQLRELRGSCEELLILELLEGPVKLLPDRLLECCGYDIPPLVDD